MPVIGWTIHFVHTVSDKFEAGGTELFIKQKHVDTDIQRHDSTFHGPFVRRLVRGSPHGILYKFKFSLLLSLPRSLSSSFPCSVTSNVLQ
jgi:hypothetical protein